MLFLLAQLRDTERQLPYVTVIPAILLPNAGECATP